jgi:hypothetical protein
VHSTLFAPLSGVLDWFVLRLLLFNVFIDVVKLYLAFEIHFLIADSKIFRTIISVTDYLTLVPF